MGKSLTIEDILERKRQSEEDRKRYKAVHSDILDGDLIVKKIPLRQVTAIMDRFENPNTTESMEMFQELIYRSCDLFKDPNLQRAYEVEGDKFDIVGAVLEENIDEITKIGEEIMTFYFKEHIPTEKEIKNS